MNVCVCMVLHNGAMWPFSKRGPPMCLFGGPRPNTMVYTTDKKTTTTEGMREREKGRKDKSSLKKDKGNWPKGPKVSSCLHLG